MTHPRNTFRFVGTLTAVSPLAVTRPDEKFPSPASSPFQLSSKAGRLPRLGAMRETSEPYFPAGSLRGAIRRAGRNLIRRAVVRETGNKTPWGVDTHYMLTQGVDVTNKTLNEKVSGVIGVENELREQNPFLSLFGRWRLPGHLGIDNAIPVNDGTGQGCLFVHGRGARSNDFVRSPDQVAFLSVEEAKRLKSMVEQDSLAAEETGDIDDQIKNLKKDRRLLENEDQDERQEINDQIQALESRKVDVKKAKAGSQESIQRPLEGFEAIKPNTLMDHRMLVQNADEIELGLFLASLREFARTPYVGGHRSLGCGEISGQWTVSYWPEDADSPIKAGEVRLSADGFDIINEGDSTVLTDALNRWTEVAGALAEQGVDFERFLLVDSSESKKAS